MINAENYRSEYIGTGLFGPFAYGFPLADKNYLMVIHTPVGGLPTVLTVDSEYTVTGVNDSNSANWYIMLTDGLPAGDLLTLIPNYPLLQKRDFNNQGGFFPETHERSADESRIIDQQLQEQLDRCLKSPAGSGILPDDLLNTITSSAAAASASATAASGSASAAAASALAAQNAAANVIVMTYEGVATEGQTNITVTPSIPSLPVSLDYIECFLDGVAQFKSTLTRTSASVLTVGGGMAAGTKIMVRAGKFAGSDFSGVPIDTLGAPSDSTTLNATTLAHGLMPKGLGSDRLFRGDVSQIQATLQNTKLNFNFDNTLSFVDPFAIKEVYSDFFEISSTVPIEGFRAESNGGGAAASIWTADSGGPSRDVNSNMGWLELRAGTALNANASLMYGGSYGGDGNDQTGRWGCAIELRFRIYIQNLSDGTNNYTITIGQGYWNGARGAFFRYTHTENSGQWVCVMGNGLGSETVINTSVAVVTGAPIDLRILYAGSGNCRYFINNVEQGSGISTNTPGSTQALHLLYARIQAVMLNAATRSVWIDKAYLKYAA